MKKMSLILAALAALVSCSKNLSVNENKSAAIGFRSFAGMQTKADAKTQFAADDVIDVYAGYNGGTYFNDDFVFSANGFNSAKAYFWPEEVSSSKPVTFMAFHNANHGTAAGQIEAFTPDADASEQKDVLFAKTSVSAVSEDILASGVPLNFRHVLSQVIVSVKNTNPNLEFVIESVKLAFVSKSGDLDLSGTGATSGSGQLDPACWSNLEDSAVDAFYVKDADMDDPFSSDQKTDLGTPWMLVPQAQTAASSYSDGDAGSAMNGSYIAVKMIIRNATDHTVIKGGTDGLWCCWPAAISFAPGFRYNYLIDLAEGGYYETNQNTGTGTDMDSVFESQKIKFSAACTIDAWAEGTI